MFRPLVLLTSILTLIATPVQGQLEPREMPTGEICGGITIAVVARERAGTWFLEDSVWLTNCIRMDHVDDVLERLRRLSGFPNESYGWIWDRAPGRGDGRIFAAAMEVAADRERPIPHRVGALRRLYATVFPGVRPLMFRQFVGVAYYRTRSCPDVVTDQPPLSSGSVPLPLDAHAQLRALADSLWADASESGQIRAAAECIRQRSEVAGLHW